MERSLPRLGDPCRSPYKCSLAMNKGQISIASITVGMTLVALAMAHFMIPSSQSAPYANPSITQLPYFPHGKAKASTTSDKFGVSSLANQLRNFFSDNKTDAALHSISYSKQQDKYACELKMDHSMSRLTTQIEFLPIDRGLYRAQFSLPNPQKTSESEVVLDFKPADGILSDGEPSDETKSPSSD